MSTHQSKDAVLLIACSLFFLLAKKKRNLSERSLARNNLEKSDSSRHWMSQKIESDPLHHQRMDALIDQKKRTYANFEQSIKYFFIYKENTSFRAERFRWSFNNKKRNLTDLKSIPLVFFLRNPPSFLCGSIFIGQLFFYVVAHTFSSTAFDKRVIAFFFVKKETAPSTGSQIVFQVDNEDILKKYEERLQLK